MECSPGFLSRETQYHCTDMAGQHQCHCLYQSHGWSKVPHTSSASHPVLEVEPTTRNLPQSSTHSRAGQSDGRRNVKNDYPRSDRLAAESSNLCPAGAPVGTISGGHVCNKTVNTPPPILFMEARAASRSNRCLPTGLDSHSRLCQPPLVLNPALPEEGSVAEGHPSDSYTSVDNLVLVPSHSATVHRLPSPATPDTRPTPPHSQHRGPKPESSNSVGRLAQIGRSLKDRGLSEEAEDLILSAWRDSTNKNYNSAWKKWESWCLHKHINPISAPIEAVASFPGSPVP